MRRHWIGLVVFLLFFSLQATFDPVTAATYIKVSGVVLLSPICPVERFPPDPACAPKPYRTVLEIKEQASKLVYKTLKTSAIGIFATSLPAGKYLLQKRVSPGQSIYPRCAPRSFTVTATNSLHLVMNCDTGIR